MPNNTAAVAPITLKPHDPGPGGAPTLYHIDLGPSSQPRTEVLIEFQDGPPQEVGRNGLTNEILLELLAHRLRSFQSGPFACRENALALTMIEEALHWLNHRTAAREARGVEGTLTP